MTGGAGFLGSHLCEKLLSEGHRVIALDNFYTGSLENITHLFNNSNFEVLNQDVCVPINIEVDAIANLACPASPVHYQRNPVETIKTNFIGASNVLDLANKLDCPVLQASTSEVYGDPTSSPQFEEYWGNVNPIGLRSCYDEGKRAAESIFFDNFREYGTNIKVARIFNTYGPRMQFNDGRVVSNFVLQALQGQEITLYGDGTQTRSFCYVDDLIDGLIRLLFSERGVTGPINLGNPQEITMIELAEKILALTKSSSNLRFDPLPSDDPRQRKPSIQRAMSELGWNPRIQLDVGLQNTIENFRSRLDS